MIIQLEIEISLFIIAYIHIYSYKQSSTGNTRHLMNFQDIQMTQSFGLKQSSNSCRLSSELSYEPYDNLNQNRNNTSGMTYKCYQCSGRTEDSKGKIKSTGVCRTCKGLKEVKDNNSMVGLLMQVMCRKLGKDVPTLKNFPKLEFSVQNKIGQKGTKVRFDPKVKYSTRSRASLPRNQVTKHHKTQPNSQGNSITDSNSQLDSSLDSLDSSHKSSSTARINPVANSNSSFNSASNSNSSLKPRKRTNTLYANQPHFRQQISEIKEESYVTQDYAMCCDLCGREGQGDGYMECKICRHYFLCLKCYNAKVEEIRSGRLNNLKEQQINIELKQKSISNIEGSPTKQMISSNDIIKNKSLQVPLSLTASPNQLRNTSLKIQQSEEQDKLKQKVERSKEDNQKQIVVNYDNFYLTHIHQHPLTLCCESKDDNPRYNSNDDDGIRESGGNCQDKEQVQENYGQFLNPNSQIHQNNYKNLFRSYQQPQSPKHQYLKMPIQVIKQQKQSPSVSASGVSISIKSNSPDHPQKYYLDSNQQQLENQSEFEGNISMTVSNNMDSPDALSKGYDASSNGSPVNINLEDSDRLGKIDCVGGIRESEDGRAQGMKMLSLLGANRTQQLQTKLLPQTKMNLDLSEWSEYSNLYIEDEASNISKQAESHQNLQSQHCIQENQNNKMKQNNKNEEDDKKMEVKSEAQGLKWREKCRIDECGMAQKQGVGSGKEAEEQGERVEKNNEYNSDKKEVGKFREIKIGVINKTKRNINREQNRKGYNEQSEAAQKSENTTSGNVILQNTAQSTAPLIIGQQHQHSNQGQNNITTNVHDQNHVSQKKCHHCQRHIQNRLMYMKCQTCLDYGQIYQLCDQCYRHFQVLDQHQKQQSITHGSLKHVFKTYLHRVSQSTGLDFGMDQEQQQQTNKNIRLSSNSNIFKSTKSFDINPLQNQSYLFTPTETPTFSTVHNQKLAQLSPNDSQNKEKVKVDSEPEDNFEFNLQVDEQIRKNQIYEKQRQKQNEENSIFVKMYQSLITDVYMQTLKFPAGNLNKFMQQKPFIDSQSQNKQQNVPAKDENIIYRNKQSTNEFINSPNEERYSSQINWSFGVFGQQKDSIQLMEGRNSSNVGIQGKWLMDPLQCQLHNSFVVDYDKQGGNSAKQSGGPTTTISQIFLYPLPSPQKIVTKPAINENLSLEQNCVKNNINVITTQQPSSTYASNKAQGSIEMKPRPSIMLQKNKINVNKLQDEKQIGKKEGQEYNRDKLLVVPVRDKDSPSARSLKSGGISPTRSKSQVSSRIKVDCGDSESEFEIHSISKGNDQIENQDYFSKQAGQNIAVVAEPILLSKSISLPKPSEANSILGKEYAMSEPEQDSDDQSSLEQEKMDEMNGDNKNGFGFSLDKNKKGEDGSNIGIKFTNNYQCKIIQYKSKDEVRQPNQQHQNAEISSQQEDEKMGFLGKIQKSQKLSKSDQQQEYHLNLHQFPIPSNSHPLKLNPFAHYQKPRSKSSLTSISPSNPSYSPSMIPIPHNNQFVFEDYNCDMCGQSPINYRYHCKYCEDFDLCQECITKCGSHRHRERSDFQKIGEKEERKLILKQKEVQKIMKQEEESKRSTIIKSVLDMFGSDHSSNALTRSSLPGNLGNTEGVYWQMGSSNSNMIVKQDSKMANHGQNKGNVKSNNYIFSMGQNSNYSINMVPKVNESSKSGCHMKSMILMGRSSRL